MPRPLARCQFAADGSLARAWTAYSPLPLHPCSHGLAEVGHVPRKESGQVSCRWQGKPAGRQRQGTVHQGAREFLRPSGFRSGSSHFFAVFWLFLVRACSFLCFLDVIILAPCVGRFPAAIAARILTRSTACSLLALPPRLSFPPCCLSSPQISATSACKRSSAQPTRRSARSTLITGIQTRIST